VRFSVLVNETTDISTMKLLCILVNYVSPETGKVTRLLELSHLDARDCAADALFNAFKICLDNKNISLNNLLCVASDEASVMVGKYNSFFFKNLSGGTTCFIIEVYIVSVESVISSSGVPRLSSTRAEESRTGVRTVERPGNEGGHAT
jgi:hypothetical protein